MSKGTLGPTEALWRFLETEMPELAAQISDLVQPPVAPDKTGSSKPRPDPTKFTREDMGTHYKLTFEDC